MTTTKVPSSSYSSSPTTTRLFRHVLYATTKAASASSSSESNYVQNGLELWMGEENGVKKKNNNQKPDDRDRDRKIALEALETINVTTPVHGDELLPSAPALSYDKFLTMQEKRVVVTIRYSGESGLRPYFLTMAKKIKASHPDVIIERRILPPAVSDDKNNQKGEQAVFEVLVDGKVIVGKTRSRKPRARSVFVSMQELDVAIARARRRRRPNTVYGGGAGGGTDGGDSLQDKQAVKLRLGMLRKNKRSSTATKQ